jgi:hypothetical protein
MERRSAGTLLITVGMLTTSAAAQSASSVAQMTRGVADSFGPGFTALSLERVQFQLTRPANVILLWIGSDGTVDLYFPLHSGDRTARKAGRQALPVGDLKSPIENPTIKGAPSSTRPGQFGPATPGATLAGSRVRDTAQTAGYWALIVGDEPTTASQVQTRLSPMSRDGTVEDILERIGPVLMEGRARLWAAYFAPVAK